MDYGEVVEALTGLYLPGQCDIEDAVWWAARIGRGFLPRHEVTWDGAEFRIVEGSRPGNGPGRK